jgi:secreted trypsin-like serine protease
MRRSFKNAPAAAAIVLIAAVVSFALSTIRSHPEGEVPVVALINHSATDDSLFLGQFCGGIVVSQKQVVTATHCLKDRKPETVDVLAGIANLCESDPSAGVRTTVKRITRVAKAPWISSLELAQPLTIEFQPVSSTQQPVRTTAVATAWGWGRSDVAGVPACTLREVPLKAVAVDRCSFEIQKIAGLPPKSVLCTVPADGVNSCVGDSGGPVLIYRAGRIADVFMTMSGEGCGPTDAGLNVPIMPLATPAR